MRNIVLFSLFFLMLPHYSVFGVLAAEKSGSVEDQSSRTSPDEEGWDDFNDDFGDEDEEILIVFDPIEPVNRGIFWFNDKVYFYLLKPVARGYRIVPELARVSVSNFFSNIYTPVRFVNSFLQLKFWDAGNELKRLVINTTWGIGGLFDPAKNFMGIEKKEEDFGQTLGVYGVGPGFYIVLPLLGASNARDGVGLFADVFLDPFYYIIPEKNGDLIYFGIKSFYTVNAVSLDKDTYESIKRRSLDPYLFIRNAYAQRRKAMIEK